METINEYSTETMHVDETNTNPNKKKKVTLWCILTILLLLLCTSGYLCYISGDYPETDALEQNKIVEPEILDFYGKIEIVELTEPEDADSNLLQTMERYLLSL